MPVATFHDLIVAAGGRPSGEVRPGDLIGKVRTDSRLVSPGDLFWALPGTAMNGHDFVGEAFRRGAACCVVEDDRAPFEGYPRIVVNDSLTALAKFAHAHRRACDAMVIAVTGSVGKTTTRNMLHSVLSARFSGSQSPANFNNHVGVPLSLLEISPQHEFAVIEMGASGVGEIADLARIAAPEAAIMTSVAPSHLEKFGSLDAIEQAKGELVEAIPHDGFVVLNGDDARVRSMSARANCRVILVGEGTHNDLRPERVHALNDLLLITVSGVEFQLPAIGRHHVLAALACIAVAREIGLSDAEIDRGLKQFQPVGGRSRKLDVGPWTIIDDTYNASPASMAAACESLRNWQTAGRKWLVLGDMLELGADSAAFHRQLGDLAARSQIDGVIATGEFAGDVISAARAAGMQGGQLAICRDLSTVLLHLDCWLAPGDVALVKGSRGMRMEQVIEQLKSRAEETPLQRRLAA
ncbi:UDP-N-acetylmuramoyl-tripeptide--D-alanyl-D-alanine ligase MurF [Caulifigura coniformis]|uniref:UDP-N-acetylmuramoyl-tripeptide--D-alanyl-D-alanine ligase n=1 Tax=Caulifigura coniformis TaxID=2527983 RepID=A0A517SG12_9PLAN|nr:UDP-N-acetylmuramoyl-tripeptide--D-alanyl-D-alanine ligase [Caulifigura coniformis]QDT55007.1 UDP-N-acetylmuramoyl-tripeptide--D-alanyl-D-alanine ligase MurF [Caulifigura coniformis]